MTASSRGWRRQWTVCSFSRTLDSYVPTLHKHEVLRTVALEEDQVKCLEKRKSTRDLLELQNRVQKLERVLMGRSSLRRDPTLPATLEQGTLILRLQQYRTEDRDEEKCTQ